MGTILALQPWDSGSHAAVRTSIERHAAMDWRFETMAGRSPRWRLRHAGLAFAERLREEPMREVDAVFATSMMSLADFRAASPGSLRHRPHILYMHENQVAYPVSPSASESDRTRDAHLAFTNLASIEAAHRAGRKPPQTSPLGGEILLHGGGSSTDWTLGCIALDNDDIDDLRSHLPQNMQVQIRVLP